MVSLFVKAVHATVSQPCAGGKAEALSGLGQGLLQPFHVNRFEPGHSATDYARWSTTAEPYSVQYRVVSCCSRNALDETLWLQSERCRNPDHD